MAWNVRGQDDRRFGLVHHRALNSPEGLRGVLPALDALPEYVHVAEGDLCWVEDGGEPLLYFHHPDRLVDALGADEAAAARRAGRLWTLEDALADEFRGLRFVIELKTGVGSRRRAIGKAVALLEAARRGRYWFDTFSLRDLARVKAACRGAPASLHTKLVAGDVVLSTALEMPPVTLRSARRLRDADLVTLTYRTSIQRRFRRGPLSTAATVEKLARAGKGLVFGGVSDPDLLREVEGSGARAGYVKFDWREITG